MRLLTGGSFGRGSGHYGSGTCSSAVAAHAFCRDYASDIKTIHVKDINPDVLAEGVATGWDYSGFTKHGIFTELGEGLVDFPAVFAILQDAGFQGRIVGETNIATQGDRS